MHQDVISPASSRPQYELSVLNLQLGVTVEISQLEPSIVSSDQSEVSLLRLGAMVMGVKPCHGGS